MASSSETPVATPPPAPAPPAPAPLPPRPVPADTDNVLDDDVLTVPGQAFALISFVSPESRQKNEKYGLKIRGVFGTRAEADAHVKRLQRTDPLFDIYLVDMYRWLLIPPDPNAIEDQEYQEDFLNKMVKGYKESQVLAKQHFEERKRSVMEQGLDANLLPDEGASRGGDGGGGSMSALETDTHPLTRGA